MKKAYNIPQIEALCNQLVAYTPREKKIEQLARAENLFHEIEHKKDYSYKFICFSITNYKPEFSAEERFPGNAVCEDLLRFIEDLSDSVALPLENIPEPVWTIEQLSERFSVSHKTISRWRKTALVGRHVLIEGKKRIGFLDGSVQKFVQNHRERIRRGGRFSQLSGEERETMIRQARILSERGGTSTEVARELSEQTGRSVETIRYTLKAFDETRRRQEAIFPNRTSPLREDVKGRICQGFRRGETVEELARMYHRTKSGIYRIVGQYRVKRIFALPLDYVDSREFAQAETGDLDGVFTAPHRPSFWERDTEDFREDDALLGPEVFHEADEDREKRELPPYLAQLYDIPRFTAEQETHLFRKMNYLKYKASKLRAVLVEAHPKARLMAQIEDCYETAVETKNRIVLANLRLVVSTAKKHLSPSAGFFELVGDGNLALVRAVETFDYTRGNKFGTYATWTIMKNFARSTPDENQIKNRFCSDDPEERNADEDFRLFFGLDEDTRNSPMRGQERHEEKQTAADHTEEAEERVRQIELRASAKLRESENPHAPRPRRAKPAAKSTSDP